MTSEIYIQKKRKFILYYLPNNSKWTDRWTLFYWNNGGRNIHFWLIGPIFSQIRHRTHRYIYIKISASHSANSLLRSRFPRSHKTKPTSPSPDNCRYPSVCSPICLFLCLLFLMFIFFSLFFYRILGANLASKLKVMKENNSDLASEL